MARRRPGYDFGAVITNVPVVVTFVVAFAAWWTAFIAQIIYEKKYADARGSGSAVGVAWFGIFLQLGIIVMLLLTLASGELETYRFQITAFLSIATVFAVIGTNMGIFGSSSYQTAIGAGWLLLSIVDILWLLFITADDATRLSGVFAPFAGDMPSRQRSMRQSRRDSAALGIGNTSASDLHSHNAHQPMSNGYGMGNGSYGGSQTALNGGGMKAATMGNTGPSSIHSHAPYGSGPANTPGSGSLAQQQQQQRASMAQAPSQPKMQQQQAQQQQMQAQQSQPPTSQSTQSLQTTAAGPEGEKDMKAKALYSYTASPDDPNEIGFIKGEYLDILDNTGKWFSARKADGTQGIVPSNYLQML